MPKNIMTPLRLLQDEPLAGDVVSQAISIQMLDNISIQVILDDVSTNTDGDMIVEVSNDYTIDPAGEPKNPGNWEAVPNTSTQITNGVPASIMYNLTGLAEAWIRLRFDNEFEESADITAVADVDGSLNDTYFFISASGVDYYVWF